MDDNHLLWLKLHTTEAERKWLMLLSQSFGRGTEEIPGVGEGALQMQSSLESIEWHEIINTHIRRNR